MQRSIQLEDVNDIIVDLRVGPIVGDIIQVVVEINECLVGLSL